jgi:hypothetical protein
MLIVWLSQVLFGAAALAFCGITCRAVLRRDKRAHFWLTIAGSVALVFFVSIPRVPPQMIGVAVAAILAGILMTPAEITVPFDSTATRKSRR